MNQLDAVTKSLIEKRVITEQELITKLKQVQSQYEARERSRGNMGRKGIGSVFVG